MRCRSGCGRRLRPGPDAWIMSHWSCEGAEGLGKAPKGFSCLSNPLPRAWPRHTLPGVSVSHPVAAVLPREKWMHGQSVEEASQGLVRSLGPGSAQPAGPPAVPAAQHRARHGRAGVWEACGFPSALGPSRQAFLWDLEQAWPWGKCSVTFSTRRNPSPGSSHGGRQCFPGCWEQRRVCGARRLLSAAHGVCWAPSVPPLYPAGVLGGRCPPAHRVHALPGTRIFPQGWLLSRSKDLNTVAAEALGLQVKTSQNTFQLEMKTRMKLNLGEG